jgi:hypothetical protein
MLLKSLSFSGKLGSAVQNDTNDTNTSTPSGSRRLQIPIMMKYFPTFQF